ncbi:MAG: DUF1549 domain-containing protein, partial [Planctomycetes bacterium]|nr:DUF1549 domain-containing protein [Planctomycetota bacterium]
MRTGTILFAIAFAPASGTFAAEPLHARIDRMIAAAAKQPLSRRSDDAEFLRRLTLDLTGTIPTSQQTRRFLADRSAGKRRKLIDRLLNGPDYPQRMQQVFSVMLLERRTGREISAADWRDYLRNAFSRNQPWNLVVRELLSSNGEDAQRRPAIRFFLDRGATSYDKLTQDVGRLFLGMDLQCAQCHDHPNIPDYKQSWYFGLYAFLNRTAVTRDRKTHEVYLMQRGNVEAVEFKSVFTGVTSKTRPKLPKRVELPIPQFKKGNEYVTKPKNGRPGVPRFFARGKLADELAQAGNDAFNRNIANRLWAMLIGRGLVQPLDRHHAGNPPSHPKLMALLAGEFARM